MDGEAGARALNASRPSSDVQLPAELEPAWAAVLSGASDFVALAYAPGSKKALALAGSGTGGYAALRAHLADDAVVYGAFRARVDGAEKLLFCTSVGEAVGGMAKGRAAMHKQDVENALAGTVGGVAMGDAEELEADAVAEKVKLALGAAEVKL